MDWKNDWRAILVLAGIFVSVGTSWGTLDALQQPSTLTDFLMEVTVGAIVGLILFGLMFGVGWLASLGPRR